MISQSLHEGVGQVEVSGARQRGIWRTAASVWWPRAGNTSVVATNLRKTPHSLHSQFTTILWSSSHAVLTYVVFRAGNWSRMISQIINGRPARSMLVVTNCSVSATQVALTRPRLKRIEVETVRLERSSIISASAEQVAPLLSASPSSRGSLRATRLKPSRTSKTGTHIATEVR